MVGCSSICFICLSRIFKYRTKNSVQSRIEDTQLQNNCEINSNSESISKKIITSQVVEPVAFRHISPIRSNIITGRSVQSLSFGQRVFLNFNEKPLEDISEISNISCNESVTPIRIPSPPMRKNANYHKTIPIIFSVTNGKMPKLNLAAPRLKMPKAISQPVCLENDC